MNASGERRPVMREKLRVFDRSVMMKRRYLLSPLSIFNSRRFDTSVTAFFARLNFAAKEHFELA
jgi:hypothetical protein